MIPLLILMSKRIELFVCMTLVLGVVLVFGQTARHKFVNFDDDRYVYDNDHVKPGLTLSGVGYYLVHRHSYTYHPVTSISHMLDCQLFGQNAGWHHAMNVLLHAATAVGLFLVLRQMTGRLWPSALVAAVFAIHPLRVELVAWISERRDVLSGLFFVLALWAYAALCPPPTKRRQLYPAVRAFALGLLAKPMLVTLPLLLLLLDYWPLKRMSRRQARPASGYPARDEWDEGALREAVETSSDSGTQIDVPCETHHSPTASLYVAYGQDSPGLRHLLLEKGAAVGDLAVGVRRHALYAERRRRGAIAGKCLMAGCASPTRQSPTQTTSAASFGRSGWPSFTRIRATTATGTMPLSRVVC